MKQRLKKIYCIISPTYRKLELIEARMSGLTDEMNNLRKQMITEAEQLWMKTSWLMNQSSGLNATKRTPRLIVSLTTIPQRAQMVHLTIESIFQQSMKPDEVILWLDKDHFDPGNLPDTLTVMRTRGLDIRLCDDIKSYKKLVFCREQYPDAVIVTADDDLIYPSVWLEKLYLGHHAHPEAVVCHRAHWILTGDQGGILPYGNWEIETQRTGPSSNIFPTGSGGVLYPPDSLHPSFSDRNLFLKLCPSADDIWFKAMAMLNLRKTYCIPGGLMGDHNAVLIRGSQTNSLGMINVDGGANDRQAEAAFNHFDLIRMFDHD